MSIEIDFMPTSAFVLLASCDPSSLSSVWSVVAMSNALIKEIRSELENAPDSYHKDLLEKKIKQLELAVQESYQNKVGKVIPKFSLPLLGQT